MNKFKKIASLFFIVLLSAKAVAQFGTMPPFTLQIEAIAGTNLPGLHSFAFAQSGDKWLIIGGRTNGLHGINASGAFSYEYRNDQVIVIDTSTWTSYSAELNQLPWAVADPIRTNNMQFIQDGDYLYMMGGYGYDSTTDHFTTYPKLTAIHVDNMINAVINSLPIASSIRQITDPNLAVCGGELTKIGSKFYLMFGHDFEGAYADPPAPIFTQVYSEKIKKFNLTDDGTTITLSNWSIQTDTTNFHRRDLNVGPIVKPDGSLGAEAYGGVFKKNVNLPFREPIIIDSSGTATVNMAYQQVMSQYTCANFPIYDSATQTMYTTFLGGISLYDYNPGTNTVSMDTLVPFISDITTLTTHASGMMEETVLPVQLSGLLGANAQFVPSPNVAQYANGVIRFRGLPGTRTLIGYMYGGIHAQVANFGISTANDSVFRIYITPDLSVGIRSPNDFADAVIYPNPAAQNTAVIFDLDHSKKIRITLLDITGKEIETIAHENFSEGYHRIGIPTSALAGGIYFCRIESNNDRKTMKVVVER